MTNVVWLKSVAIGVGRPKIAVSIAGETAAELQRKLRMVLTEGRDENGWSFDLIEIRMDSFLGVNRKELVYAMLKKLREENREIPFLFTYRNRREGGRNNLLEKDYGALLLWAAESGYIDAVDVEAVFFREMAPVWIQQIQDKGVPVVASYHDIMKTPQNMDTILKILSESGGEIVKLAVTAKTEDDVDRLKEASRRFADCGGKPIISMAMGEIGRCTRIMLEETGSAVTFGAIGTPSAPGQMPVKELVPWIMRHKER